MERKKIVRVKLYSDRKHYTVVEVYEDEVEKVRETNRMTWQEDKAEERRRKKLEEDGITLCSLDKTDADGDNISDEKMSVEERIIEEESRQENNARLYAAISKLNPRQREMIKMVYFKDMSQDDIAKKYGITKASVSDAMQRIYASLKKYLEKN